MIDSYITPETPNKFVLSFFTSDSCTSKLTINHTNTMDVSKTLSENHKIELELGKLKIGSREINYQINVFDRNGKETSSDQLIVRLPEGLVITREQNPGLFSICLGGIVFAIPSPTYVNAKDGNYWSLSKEIPLINFYSIGYNYPSGYLSLEYSHLPKAERKNFLRFGYKQIIQIPLIKYVSPGLSAFTDFKGYSGVGAEISFGLFQIQNVFTFYTRYRYNFQLIEGGRDFHEISAGLYSNFFTLNL
ncbi:MAG: hypothetical protein NTX65_17000 [Ignavibacteriales bacterium]|nr:hypothetical protein [Ignavibacteriales bacterium]